MVSTTKRERGSTYLARRGVTDATAIERIRPAARDYMAGVGLRAKARLHAGNVCGSLENRCPLSCHIHGQRITLGFAWHRWPRRRRLRGVQERRGRRGSKPHLSSCRKEPADKSQLP